MSAATPDRRSPSPLLLASAFAAAVVVALLPWWRNHLLIADPYDWSAFVAAIGKWHAGLRPYVDYDTPLQSGSILVNYLAELLFGPRYLSLTYANVALILIILVGGWAILRRSQGDLRALLVSTACSLLTAGQYAVMTHNTLAVAVMAAVLWPLAAPPTTRIGRTLAMVAAVVALALGGMMKLNFQFVTLVFAGGLIGVTVLAGRLPWWRGVLVWLALLVLGLVVPVALELAISGADFALWRYNIFELPHERFNFFGRLTEPGFYFAHYHNFYHAVYVRAPAAVAVGSSALLGVLLAVAAWRSGAPHPRLRATAALLGGLGAGFAGAALVATNVEIAFIPLACVIVLGWSLILVDGSLVLSPFGRAARMYWSVATAALLVLAFISAWAGSRILYGNPKARRADFRFVSADDLPAEFAYFRGTRITPEMHAAFLAVHRELDGRPETELRQVYFTYGMDWLERVWPATTTRGLPLWLHEGTTYRQGDWAGLFARIVVQKNAQRIITVPHWDLWPRELKISLEQNYAIEDLAPHARVYRHRGASQGDGMGVLSQPIPFLFHARSNLMTRLTRADRTLYALDGPLGRFAGNSESTRWELDFVSYRATGEAVAMLTNPADPLEHNLEFRVVARGSEGDQVLWQERVTLSSATPHRAVPFAVDPGGRPMRLETTVPAGAAVLAGWQKFFVMHSGPVEENPPVPIQPDLLPASAEGVRLFADVSTDHPVRVYGNAPQVEGDTITLSGPGEIWSTLPAPTARMTGRLDVPEIPGGAEKVYVRVNWYKSGRLEFFVEETLEPGTAKNFLEFDRPMAEPEGWIGLMVLNPAKDGKPVAVRFRPFQRH